MKHLKILALAAIAAAALTALAGAGTASATVLCKTTITTNCALSGQDYSAGTELHLTQEEGTTLTLTTTGGVSLKTCTGATIKGATTNTGSSSETVKGVWALWNWGVCSRLFTTLEIGSFEIHHIAGTDNGTLTSSGTNWTTNTIFGTCVYGTGTALDLGVITGGNPATVDINSVIPKISGNAACPAHGVLHGSFWVTSPKPLYVSAS